MLGHSRQGSAEALFVLQLQALATQQGSFWRLEVASILNRKAFGLEKQRPTSNFSTSTSKEAVRRLIQPLR